MCITANKFKGIRAAVCHDNFSAERSVLSNNANVLCMGERVIGHELAKKIVGEWISLEFKDGSFTPKVQEILDIESETMR
jgi:ribose 5-phosphate isomerase B